MLNQVNTVEKPWGREIHFAVEKEYAGKILEVNAGERLSLQYHRVKKETMYVLSGLLDITVGDNTFKICPGQSITLNPNTIHRLCALEDSRVVEVSTIELDDVVRLEDDHGRL
jgi:mannose-6-phosphate isomerase